jgi:hypothetical protein
MGTCHRQWPISLTQPLLVKTGSIAYADPDAPPQSYVF